MDCGKPFLRLGPVAGTTGDLFPHLFVDLVRILFDRKILAAHRAAKSDHASTDPELNFLAAGLAFHEGLESRTKDFTTEGSEKTKDGGKINSFLTYCFLRVLCG
jgi:hypothetical protein